MLRITVYEEPHSVTFHLEGRLAGGRVQELEECWQRTVATKQKPLLRVDLAGVTFVDAAGQGCLMTLHRQGAQLLAADCVTKAVVDEITQEDPPDSVSPNVEGLE